MPFRTPASILRTPLRSTAVSRTITPPWQRSLTTTPRMHLKEDAHRSGEEIEAKKQESLEKQRKGEGHWHEELGSASESHIAADREHVEDHDHHIGKLQEETKRKGKDGKL